MKKGVSYIRVSTKSDAQLHSFEFQEYHWRKAIDEIEGYYLVGIYADKGISGRRLNNRRQFLAMMQAARRGEFDTIFTKSVARFGRNTEEIMRSVKELRDLGINVIFETENIDTKSATSELYLTIAAAIAQDALRTNAENMRWSARRRFAEGQVSIGNGMFGYRMINGVLEIQESEAEVVRLIFNLYLNGMGKQGIANYLSKKGIKTYNGNDMWAAGTIENMLVNEKYCGDSLLQKSVTIDGVQYPNDDLADKYYYQGTHEGIISREDFERVQKVKVERSCGNEKSSVRGEYAFSTKIKCGICGCSYGRKINGKGTVSARPIWVCRTYISRGKGVCASHAIHEDVLQSTFFEAYNEFVGTKEQYVTCRDAMANKKKLLEDERKLKALAVKRLISEAEYAKEHKQILDLIRVEEAEIKFQAMTSAVSNKAQPILEYNDEAVLMYLCSAVVADFTITFEFVNGCKITKTYTNGTGGNKKGWSERRRSA